LKFGIEENCLLDEEVFNAKKSVSRKYQSEKDSEGNFERKKGFDSKRKGNNDASDDEISEVDIDNIKTDDDWFDDILDVLTGIYSAGLCYYGIPQLKLEK
jgi:hypothetical protein